MTHRVSGGRRSHAEPLEERIALTAQTAAGGDAFDAFRALYPSAFDNSDPYVQAALANITTTAPDDELLFRVDPAGPATGAGDDVSAALVQSSAVIRLNEFRNDLRFAGIDGRNFSVVVVDTGVDLDHPFFGPDADNNGVADRIVYAADFVGDRPSAQDGNGHGTHTSSIAVSQDAIYGGVAPGANLIHLRVLNDSGAGTAAGIEAALQWVAAHVSQYNIASVNMSIGTGTNFASPNTQPNFGISDELAALAAQNVIVAAAAGNEFYEFQSRLGVSYPAADPNAIAVSASWDANVGGPVAWGGPIDFTTGPDRVVSFSQRHPTMTTIFAPGALITAAAIGGGVQAMGGTSMAAPQIAGLAALAQQLAMQTTLQRLTPAQFKEILSATGTPIFDGDDENDNVANSNQWYHRVDVLALANAIISGGAPDLSLPTGISLDTASVPAGGTARVNVLIANQGPAATGATTSGFYLSTDPVKDNSDRFLSSLPGNLGGGQSSLHSALAVPLPSDVASGEYYILAVVDDAQAVAEGNEANNVAAAPLTISAPQPEITLVDVATGGTLVDGLSVVEFGIIEQGAADIVKSFRIDNDGSQPLTLGTLILPAGYSANGFPATVAPGQFANITIRLIATSAVGAHNGELSFATNDADENPFTITLQGKVVEPDDHGNDASTATAVTMPALVSGTIFSNGEVDWFRIQAVGGVTHRFETILGTLSDSVLKLYAPDETTLLVSDDDSGPGLASLISWSAPADGTYYLEVSRKGIASGTYQLSVVPVDDHGGAAASATSTSDPSLSSGAIEAPGDEDWYAFPASAGVQYTIQTVLETLSGATIRLFDVDGTSQLAVSAVDVPNIGSIVRWTAPKDGVYFIAIEASSPELMGTYDMSLVGDDDHGDNAPNATGLTPPGSNGGEIETPFDVDWFAVTAVGGARYQFSTTLGTLVDSVIRVIGADGATELARNDDAGGGLASLIQWTAPTNGTYYVEVSGHDLHVGTYTVTSSVIDDHGNNAAGATAATDPSAAAGVISLAGDVDWFKFQAIAGVAYRFEATPGSLPAAKVRLLGVNGVTQLATQSGLPGQAAVIQWTAPANGQYYVEVSAAEASQVGKFQLKITGDDDHGDNPQNATLLLIPHPIDGKIERGSDADWFALTTLPGLAYRVEVGLGTLPNARLRVYAADGATVVAENLSNSDPLVAVQWTAAAGLHYIEVVEDLNGPGGVTAADAGGNGGNYRVTPMLLSPLPGDFDGDVDVDGNDFLVWQRLVGLTSLTAVTRLDSGGFEAFNEVPLENQFGWKKLGSANSTATVQSDVVQAGEQAVEVNRHPNTDTWWGVPLGDGLPTGDFILVMWDMQFDATNHRNGALGPFFGVEAYDDIGVFGQLASFGVDATTSDLLYQHQDDGNFVETGRTAAAGVWHHFAISLDFTRYEYTVYFNGQPLATTGFVDRGASHTALDQFTDADIATHATQNNSNSKKATGTAYFDNFRILDGVSGAYLQADGNRDGVVDGLDLAIWKDHYGLTFGESAGGGATSAVAAAVVVESAQISVSAQLYSAPLSRETGAEPADEPRGSASAEPMGWLAGRVAAGAVTAGRENASHRPPWRTAESLAASISDRDLAHALLGANDGRIGFYGVTRRLRFEASAPQEETPTADEARLGHEMDQALADWI